MEMHFSQNNSPSYRLIELDEVDSTNSYLRRLDVQSDQRPVLVTAEFQSAGRGADTNRWESERGKNLLFSLRLMPKSLPARRMFAISEATALAVKDSLDTFLPSQLSTFNFQLSTFLVKWPNDIYYGDSKVAGILIENDLQGPLVQRSTIGIGINVNQRRFLSDAPNPRSLADIVGHDVERRFVLERFMESFTHHFRQIEDGNPEALDALHETYKSHLYRLGEEHSYSDKDGTFRATLTDVEPTGHLILRDTEGILRRYAFKEVKWTP
jgi:BirA family biotin operon repressor/biotin-[acetyl-CoA-carboxylase] ligase